MSRTVLVVEDDPSLSEMIEVALNVIPEIVVATTGDEATALARIRALRPALAIVDITLPFSKRLIEQLRSVIGRRELPIIGLSGWKQRSFGEIEQQVDEVVHTPFDVESFIRLVQSYLPESRERAAS